MPKNPKKSRKLNPDVNPEKKQEQSACREKEEEYPSDREEQGNIDQEKQGTQEEQGVDDRAKSKQFSPQDELSKTSELSPNAHDTKQNLDASQQGQKADEAKQNAPRSVLQVGWGYNASCFWGYQFRQDGAVVTEPEQIKHCLSVFLRSAMQGDAYAQVSLATCYLEYPYYLYLGGWDEIAAAQLFELAADQGHLEAVREICERYQYGRVVCQETRTRHWN